MESTYKVSWMKVIGAFGLLCLVIALFSQLIPKNTSNALDNSTSTYISNISLMKSAGFQYFQGSNLPENVGSSNSISLQEMVDDNLLVAFLDENGNTCSGSDSYVKVTKTLDNEYAMKVALSCDSKSDYIVTSIANDNNTTKNVLDNKVSKDIVDADNLSNGIKVTSDDGATYVPNNNATGTVNKVVNNNQNVNQNINNSNNNNVNNVNKWDGVFYPDFSKDDNYKNTSAVNQFTIYNINYINNCLSSCFTNVCNNSCLANIYYTVDFDTVGGTYVAQQTVKSGNTARYVSTYKTGYRFLGWYLNGQKFDFATPIKERITLVAKWEKEEPDTPITPDPPVKKEYRVSFDSNGGTYVSSQDVREGDVATRPNDPSRNCYEFTGWYYNGEKYDFNRPVNSNITLVARWVPDIKCNKYNVNFEPNGGTPIDTERVTYGDKVREPNAPIKECYIFKGWYIDRALTKKYNFNDSVTSDITLYAKWEEDIKCNKYQVNFNSNGGTYVEPQGVSHGNRAYRPSDPVKQCYRFDGWYTSNSLTERYNFNNSVTSNMTLYAKWIDDGSCVQNHRVSFDSNGGSYVRSQDVKDGNYAYEPSAPSKNGYRFVGWYYNGSKFNFNRRIYTDYTLVAKWESLEQKYNTYCKISNKRYYSTSYVLSNQSTWSMNWQIRFNDLNNVQDLRITNHGYISSTSMYNDVYYDYLNGKNISSDSTSSMYEEPIPSAQALQNYSLKSNNFTKSLSTPYYQGGRWYTNASVVIRSYNGVTPYVTSRGGKYFVPFYFDVSYTDMNNCVDDLASNSSRYRDYKIVKSFYR